MSAEELFLTSELKEYAKNSGTDISGACASVELSSFLSGNQQPCEQITKINAGRRKVNLMCTVRDVWL